MLFRFTLSLIIFGLIFPYFIFAADTLVPLDFYGLFQKIFNVFLVIFISLVAIVILWATFVFITSGGMPERIQKARQILTYALIGIAVSIYAAAIPFILMNIMGIEKPIAGLPTTTQTCSQKGGICCPSNKICTATRISGATDCTDCCSNANSCQDISTSPSYPTDPIAALDTYLSSGDTDPSVSELGKRRSEIDNLFGF